MNPPVDFYFRPYFLAAEGFLPYYNRWGLNYCSGPEVTYLRVLHLAYDFATSFTKRPYFGIFWTNSVSHNYLNGPSSMDNSFYVSLLYMQKTGVFNTSMVILMSDHGPRFGNFRQSELGWHEDRLPLLYVWIPQWFKDQNPEVCHALKENQNKLISAFDLYETLRDVLMRAGGDAPPSFGCPTCTSLLKPVPDVRGCRDAGIPASWCVCAKYRDVDHADERIIKGVNKFLEYVENIVKNYEKNGTRLCAKLKLKKIHKVSLLRPTDRNDKSFEIFYKIETSPGGAKFEFTVHYDSYGKCTISEEEISRVNSYQKRSVCLEKGKQQKYCQCKDPHIWQIFRFG